MYHTGMDWLKLILGGEDMDSKFIRERITQLRIQKDVSEYEMGYALGRSRSYIQNISSGKSLPLMNDFLNICNYFNISPSLFFDESIENPVRLQKAFDELRKLNAQELEIVLQLIENLNFRPK